MRRTAQGEVTRGMMCGEKKPAVVRTGTSGLQTEGRTKAKAIGREHIRCVPGTVRSL